MSDRILFSIGEALIDMIPSRVGCSFDEVPAFSPRVGGAPANVCAAVARLGGRSALLSQLGDDPFGHKIARALAGCGVDLSHLEFTGKASTALAFVSLAENGERTFSFCRKPSADLLYAPEQIDPGWFSQAFALHFCSVSLVDSPMRYAHLAAITAAREAGAILSFDPNLRFPLWPDREQLRQTVWQFLPLTHILKLSDEELPFLTGTEDIEAALPTLFTGDVQLVLYTCGSKGAYAYTRAAHAFAPCQKVRAVDTTGAGDGFIGSFLWQLSRDDVTVDKLEKLSCKNAGEVPGLFQPILRPERTEARCHRQLPHPARDGPLILSHPAPVPAFAVGTGVFAFRIVILHPNITDVTYFCTPVFACRVVVGRKMCYHRTNRQEVLYAV